METDDRAGASDFASGEFWDAVVSAGEHVSIPEQLVPSPGPGRLRRGRLEPGAWVRAGRTLGRIESPTTAITVEAPADGVFLGWLAWEGEVVGTGALVGRFAPQERPVAAVPKPAARWFRRPAPPHLTRGAVHVWRSMVGRTSEAVALAVLDRSERERMSQLPDWRRVESISARVLLRRILALYLDRAPREVRLRVDAGGKPALAEGELRFNVSHSAGLAVIAVHADAEVGIDIERVRSIDRWQAVARRVMGPTAVKAIRALPYDQRAAAFLDRWTESEAALKAVGTGVTAVSADASAVALDSCTTFPFIPAEGWIGSLAVAGPARKIRWLQFEPSVIESSPTTAVAR